MTVLFTGDRSLYPSDCYETCGDLWLTPIRWAAGSKVVVEKAAFSDLETPCWARVAGFVLSLLLFPVLLPLTLAGFVFTKCFSTSYHQVAEAYQRSLLPPPNVTNKNAKTSCLVEEVSKPLSAGEKRLVERISSAIEAVSIDDEAKELSLETVEVVAEHVADMAADAVAIHNKEMVDSLEIRLQEIFQDQNLVNVCLQDSAVIPEAVRQNQGYLTEEMVDRIVAHVQQLTDVKEKLEELKHQLREGLPASVPIIEAKEPSLLQIAKLQGKMGVALKASYYKIINEAMVTAQVKQRGRNRGNRVERLVLSGLGYNVDKGGYDNIDIVTDAIRIAMTRLLRADQITNPPNRFKELLADVAYIERAKIANVPKNSLMPVKTIIAFTEGKSRDYRFALRTFSNLEGIEERMAEKLPQTVAFYSGRVKQGVFAHTKILLQRLVSEFKKERLDARRYLDEAAIKEVEERWLSPREVVRSGAEEAQKVKKGYLEKLQWLNLLNDPDVKIVEYSQGEEDSSAALGDGVCFAICKHTDRMLHQNPLLSLDDNLFRTISPEERFRQAKYNVEPDRLSATFGAEKELKDWHYELISLNVKENKSLEEMVLEWFIQVMNNSAPNERSALIMIKGHALFFRFDAQNKRYIFRDPNFLTAERNDEDPRAGCLWLINLVGALLKAHYSDTTHVIGATLRRKVSL